jgi:hypothetical protein
MKILITKLITTQSRYRPNFFSEVISAGKIEGEFLIIDDDTFKLLNVGPIPPVEHVLSPGTLLTNVIHQVTGKHAANCSACSDRARQMNQWGWTGCWINRDTIIQWLTEEVRKLGYEVDDNSVGDLLVAALKERLTL